MAYYLSIAGLVISVALLFVLFALAACGGMVRLIGLGSTGGIN